MRKLICKHFIVKHLIAVTFFYDCMCIITYCNPVRLSQCGQTMHCITLYLLLHYLKCEMGVFLSQSNQKVYFICGILQIYFTVYKLDVGKHYTISTLSIKLRISTL